MKVKILVSALLITTFTLSSFAQKKVSERLFMAKFLLIRLQPAELTDDQLEKIERLSEVTHQRVLQIREDHGISREVMKHRDEIFNKLRDVDKLRGQKLHTETAKQAKLSDEANRGFEIMLDVKKEFTKTVMAMLTPEQKAKYEKAQLQKKIGKVFLRLDKDEDGFLKATDFPKLNQDAFDNSDNNVDYQLSEKEYKSYVHYANRIVENRALIPEGTRIFHDVAYIENGHERQKLDLYLPENADSKKPLPLVIWIHGGGWQKGTKQLIGHQMYLLKHGFAVASVNYRLSRTDIFPAQIHDCKAAVRFLRKNAEQYNLNADNFGLWGSSAGGHLVSLMGTSNDIFDGDLGVTDVSSEVKAVCNWFGVTDFEVMNNAIKSKPKRAKPVTKLLGGTVEDRPDIAKHASPITHVTSDDPPFLIMHGTADKIVPMEQSQIFYEKLIEKKVAAEYVIVEDWKHAFFKNEKELDRVVEFFSKHLK